MNDMMKIRVSGREEFVHVPGWDDMYENDRTRNRALTLNAMAQLEVDQATKGARAPTQRMILDKLIDMGGTLSPTSVAQIQKNIQRLMKDGHIILKPGASNSGTEEGRGRGGPTSPWTTVYIYPMIRESVKGG